MHDHANELLSVKVKYLFRSANVKTWATIPGFLMQFTCDQCMDGLIWQIYLHFSRIMFPLGMPTCFCFK